MKAINKTGMSVINWMKTQNSRMYYLSLPETESTYVVCQYMAARFDGTVGGIVDAAESARFVQEKYDCISGFNYEREVDMPSRDEIQGENMMYSFGENMPCINASWLKWIMPYVDSVRCDNQFRPVMAKGKGFELYLLPIGTYGRTYAKGAHHR